MGGQQVRDYLQDRVPGQGGQAEQQDTSQEAIVLEVDMIHLRVRRKGRGQEE